MDGSDSDHDDYNESQFWSYVGSLKKPTDQVGGSLKRSTPQGSTECRFFELALSIADDAGINRSGPLLAPFQELLDTATGGIVQNWNGIPFDDPIAPRGAAGYMSFVKIVFDLLGQLYLAENGKYKSRVREVLDNAHEVAQLRQDALDKHEGRRNHQKTRESHEEILRVWKSAIAHLENIIANDIQ